MFKRIILLCLFACAVLFLCGYQFTPRVSKKPGNLPVAIQATATPQLMPKELPGELTTFFFIESSSYLKRVQSYEFLITNGMPAVHFWFANEDEPYEIAVDQPWIDALTDILRQYSMMSWNGFTGTAAGLLDGTQFSLAFTLSDGTSVRASGYGKFPPDYRTATSLINAHFLQLLPADLIDW